MARSLDMAAMSTEQLYHCLRSQRPVSASQTQSVNRRQVGKVFVAVDEEVQPFAIVFARPLASQHLPSRIIGMEVRTAER
jgi:hypothetical protein